MRLTALEPMWGIATYDRDGVRYLPGDPTREHGQRALEMNPQYKADPLFPNGRDKMSVTFRCPVHFPGECALSWVQVPFANPIDGGPKALEGQGKARNHWWQRSGESFENLTLQPSIKFPEEGPEHWHGYVTNGEVR